MSRTNHARPHRATVSERIRNARRAQLIQHYESEGYPLELVKLLNAYPHVTLYEALDGFSIPVQRVA